MQRQIGVGKALRKETPGKGGKGRISVTYPFRSTPFLSVPGRATSDRVWRALHKATPGMGGQGRISVKKPFRSSPFLSVPERATPDRGRESVTQSDAMEGRSGKEHLYTPVPFRPVPECVRHQIGYGERYAKPHQGRAVREGEALHTRSVPSRPGLRNNRIARNGQPPMGDIFGMIPFFNL